jgi:hypothetical protein
MQSSERVEQGGKKRVEIMTFTARETSSQLQRGGPHLSILVQALPASSPVLAYERGFRDWFFLPGTRPIMLTSASRQLTFPSHAVVQKLCVDKQGACTPAKTTDRVTKKPVWNCYCVIDPKKGCKTRRRSRALLQSNGTINCCSGEAG